MARARLARLAQAVHIVTPETVVTWHRRGFRLFWTWKTPAHRSTGRLGRCARADPRDVDSEFPVGCPSNSRRAPEVGDRGESIDRGQIHATASASTVITWRTFLTNHASQIRAADLFVVPTVTFRLLFVLVILEHNHRQIVHVAVTEHPTAAWAGAQAGQCLFRSMTRRDISFTIAIQSLLT